MRFRTMRCFSTGGMQGALIWNVGAGGGGREGVTLATVQYSYIIVLRLVLFLLRLKVQYRACLRTIISSVVCYPALSTKIYNLPFVSV